MQCLVLLCLSFALGANAEPIDELREFVSDEKDRLGIPGVSIGLIDGGTIEYIALGVRRADAEDGMSSADAFSIGSISKPITAWGIIKLAEQGLLSLDEPVGEYLGERWQLPDSDFDHDEVTLRKILSHTAGLSARSYFASIWILLGTDLLVYGKRHAKAACPARFVAPRMCPPR